MNISSLSLRDMDRGAWDATGWQAHQAYGNGEGVIWMRQRSTTCAGCCSAEHELDQLGSVDNRTYLPVMSKRQTPRLKPDDDRVWNMTCS